MSPCWTENLSRLSILGLLLAVAGCASAPQRQVAVEADGELEPVYPAAAIENYSYALGLMDAGETKEARAALEKLAAKYPEYAGPLTNLAILAADGGDDAQAAAYLEQALAVCANCAQPWNQLGVLHRRAGRFDAAEAAYLAAVDSDPDYALAHYNLGVLYDLYQQRHETAVLHYERYVALAADGEGTAQVGKWIADLAYAGYALHCTLELLRGSPEPSHVGLWNLLQLPHGGEMFIPTYYRTEPTPIVGEVPTGHLVIQNHLIRFRMAARGCQKIGIPAAATPGRVGYLYRTKSDSVHES